MTCTVVICWEKQHTHTHLHTLIQAHSHTHMHSYTYTCARTCIHNAHTHLHIHTHTHLHTRTHTCTYTHARSALKTEELIADAFSTALLSSAVSVFPRFFFPLLNGFWCILKPPVSKQGLLTPKREFLYNNFSLIKNQLCGLERWLSG